MSELIIPDRFSNAVFDDKTDMEIKKISKDFLTNYGYYLGKGIGPGFFGPSGIGKTYATAAIARELSRLGVNVKWSPTVSDLNKLLDFRDFKSAAYFKLKDVLSNTEVVIFDDFGQLRHFERIRELFFEIVDYRYSWKYCTIFTANDIDIAKVFNPTIARRIDKMTAGLQFNYV